MEQILVEQPDSFEIYGDVPMSLNKSDGWNRVTAALLFSKCADAYEVGFDDGQEDAEESEK